MAPRCGAAGHADLDREVEDQGQVGAMRAQERRLQSVDQLKAEAAGAALVDAGRVGEAVAQDPLAAIKCRQDGAMEVILARGEEEIELGQRAPALGRAVHDQLADRLRTLRAAGLAGDEAVDAALRASSPPDGAAGCSCPSPRRPRW